MPRAPALVFALVLVAARAWAGGLERAEQSPEGAGTAGAQAADAYAAAAAYYDPAALAFQRGLTIQAGAAMIGYHGTVTPASGGAAEATGLYATPTVFVGQRVSARYAVGIGLFDPFSASVTYPATWAGRLAGTALELRALAVNPSVAIRPLPRVALGFGVDIVPTTFAYRRAAQLGGGEGELRLDGSATGFGGNAAVLVRVVPRWLDAAVTYRSAVDVDLTGRARQTAPAGVTAPLPLADLGGTLPLPHAFTFAVASRPLPGLTVTTDVRLTLWHDLRALAFTLDDPAMMQPPGKETITLDWQDTVGVRAGASYRFWPDAADEPRLAVRLGAGWDQGPTSPAAAAPPFADGDRILVAAGLGARLGAFAVDVGYEVALVPEYRAASGTFFARYQALTHTLVAAVTLRLPTFPRKLDEPDYKW